MKFEKSFASYEGTTKTGKKKVDCWSDKNELKPNEVYKCSGKKFLFNCDKCSHLFDATLSHICGDDTWCPYCAGKKLCKKQDCEHCFQRSFASYEGTTDFGKRKVDCWSDKNEEELKPRDIFKGSDNNKFWFDCDKCPHTFNATLADIVCKNSWCPYCAGRILCKKEDCDHCFHRSFASYEGTTDSGKRKVDCWSDKNPKNPRDVMKNCNTKFWFNCDKDHGNFKSQLCNIYKGRWCPSCSESKGEKELKRCLEKLGYSPSKEHRFKDCKDKLTLPFDYYIDQHRVLFEYDGEGHFQIIWGGKKKRKRCIYHDIIKNKYCLENNYILVRIPYTEIKYIETITDNILDKIKNGKIQSPQIIFVNPKLYKTAYFI